jgi:ribose/xylose/arabinose/galactoside ABC-type transport system permease subunit
MKSTPLIVTLTLCVTVLAVAYVITKGNRILAPSNSAQSANGDLSPSVACSARMSR